MLPGDRGLVYTEPAIAPSFPGSELILPLLVTNMRLPFTGASWRLTMCQSPEGPPRDSSSGVGSRYPAHRR